MVIAMKNKQIDLHNHLFAQLERLANEQLIGDDLKEEVKRSNALTRVAREIVLNGTLALHAKIALRERTIDEMPEMLLDNKDV